jgi:hypothetical protein
MGNWATVAGSDPTDARAASRARLLRKVLLLGSVVALAVTLEACSGSPSPTGSGIASRSPSSPAPRSSTPSATLTPQPAHIVIVVLENHSYGQVVDQPYLASLEQRSAVLTDAHAVTHPSEPNYLTLWSGSPQGLSDDSCPHRYSADSLGEQVLRAGKTVAGYFESMPSAGFAGCTAGPYARKHNPLADFPVTAGAAHNLPLSAYPAKDLTALPQVALVVPDLDNDMHDGSVAAGDSWLRHHVEPYARWAATHDSVLVVTWDENDDAPGNRILTLVSGQHVRPGRYDPHVTHVNVLHTIESLLGLAPLGPSAAPITGIWR